MLFYYFYLAVFAAFVIRTLKTCFYHVYLWQLKEYRFDRFRSFLKTVEGKRLLLSPISLIKWVLLLIIFTYPKLSVGAFYMFWLVWLAETVQVVRLILHHNLRFPKFTLKSTLIILLVFSSQFNPIIFSHWSAALIFGPVLDKLLAPAVVLAVLIINIPFSVIRILLNYLSSLKIRRGRPVVIGITGSFGKTSTKEFLYQLLCDNFKVAKSPQSINTEIGLSLYILNNLKRDCDFFIAELGAYEKGEIKKICSLYRPGVGIITGIGNQHLDLFGSMENLINAKFELIDSLPQTGFAVLNTGSPLMEKINKMAKTRLRNVYQVDKNKDVRNLRIGKSDFEFDYRMNGNAIHFKANLVGIQHLENLILAIKTANILGVPSNILKRKVTKITPPKNTMQILHSTKELTLIDNTFNVNYQGVVAGIKYLELYRGLKAVVLNPIIELGSDSESVHREIGRITGNICDYLLVTNLNYFDSLKKGILESEKKKTSILHINEKEVNFIADFIEPDSVVLFAGKEAAKWIPFFKKY